MDGPQSESFGSNGAHGDTSSPENKECDPKYAKLYQAVRTGNLKATREFLEKHPGAVTATISIDHQPPLQVAALFGHLEIVKELLQRMSEAEAALPNSYGVTALHEAAFGGKDVAECIIKKNRALLGIPEDNLLPVARAFVLGKIKMARYLYPLTPPEVLMAGQGSDGILGATLLNLCCCCGTLDIALDLLDKCPRLAVTQDRDGKTFLEAMASTPSSFPSGCQLSFWQRWIYKWIEIPKEQLRTFNREIHEAISVDMPETRTSQSEERITTKKKSNNNTMAFFGDTLLHTAGVLARSVELHNTPGAALQMQRELQWFKEVESIVLSHKKEAQNFKGLTAQQIFTENHEELAKQGEKWMKETASSCSLVAALVATIVFATAFTIPGGNDQNTGYPIFSKKKGFMIFILSDALSLFSSTTSILMFLGILTSRYAEDDFLKSLPRKLIIGLLILFISIASMLIAFCVALFIMLRGQLWIVIPVSFLAVVPVISFCWLQYPLLLEMIMSTYGPSIFDRDVKPWLTADFLS